MSETMVWTRNAGAVFLMAAAFCLGSAIGGLQEAKQEPKQEPKQEAKKEGSEKKAPAKAGPETHDYRLTLLVAAGENPAPINRANVTVFYGEESREAPTGRDGRVTFKFTTAAKVVTVRVRADKFNPYQATVSLAGGELEHRAMLTPSN